MNEEIVKRLDRIIALLEAQERRYVEAEKQAKLAQTKKRVVVAE